MATDKNKEMFDRGRWEGSVDQSLKNITKSLEDLSEIKEHMAHSQEAILDVRVLEEKIYGNGKTGLIIDVDRNHQLLKAMCKTLWALGIVVFGLFIRIVFAYFGIVL